MYTLKVALSVYRDSMNMYQEDFDRLLEDKDTNTFLKNITVKYLDFFGKHIAKQNYAAEYKIVKAECQAAFIAYQIYNNNTVKKIIDGLLQPLLDETDLRKFIEGNPVNTEFEFYDFLMAVSDLRKLSCVSTGTEEDLRLYVKLSVLDHLCFLSLGGYQIEVIIPEGALN